MKARLLQKMGLDDRGDRTSPSKGLENTPSVSNAKLAPSGKSVSSWLLIGSHPTCLPSERSRPGSTWILFHARILWLLADTAWFFSGANYAHWPKQARVELMEWTMHLAENKDSEDAIQLLLNF